MFKSKKFLTSSLTIFLSTTSVYAVDPAPVGPRSVKVPVQTGNIATFSNGVGLDRGNIPITAVKMGYFFIPNGGTKNPGLTNNTPVTFQKIGNNWVAYVNGVAQIGEGAPVFFSENALNYPVGNKMRVSNGQLQWEDTVAGDNDYDDAILTVSVPHTEINDTSQLVLSNGTYQIPPIIKYKVQQTGISSNADFKNTIGHYFADAAGNPLSGYVDFANIKANFGITSNQNYSGNSPFGAGSTLQYEFPATVIADVAGTNIAAVDMSTIPEPGGTAILRIDQSARLGSVVNKSGRTNNQLSVQILPDRTVTITGTGGIMYNGKGAPVNNYDGLKEIIGTAANTATVEVANPDFEVVLNAPVGTNGKLRTFSLLNRSVELKKTLDTSTIEFTNPNQVSALKLSGGVDLGSTNITSSSTSRAHNVWVYSDQNIMGNVGTANNPFGVVKIYNNKRVKVNTLNFYSDVYTSTNDTGIVEFVKNGAISYSLGEPGNYLSLVKFTESGEVRGSAYSKNITIPSGKTASFKKRTKKNGAVDVTPYIRTPSGFILEGVGSTANFGDQSLIYAPNGTSGDIVTSIANEGIVNFEGSAEVRMHIGTTAKRVKQVTFAANDLTKSIILARDIHASNINLTKATYTIDAGGTFDGNTTANSPTINFGQHIEVFKGGQTTFTGTPVFNVYFDNVSNSHLTVSDKGSNVNLAPATSLTFNVTDNSTLPPKNGRVYYFFRIENGASLTQIDPAKVIVNQSQNPFMKWGYSFGNLTQTRNIENGLRTIVVAAGGNVNSIPAALMQINPDSNGSAAKFLQDLATLSSTNLAAAGESLRRVIQATNPTGQVAINTSQSALSSIVAARINNTQLFQFRLSEAEGIAAGNDLHETKRGVWMSPFINQANQKAKGEEPGYKSKAYGGSIGFDGKINDDLILGVAGTYLNTTINYKDFKTGDKTKIDTYMGSLYSLYNLPNNWFIQGILSFAANTVKNKKPRIAPDVTQDATGKYYSNTYGVEAMIGYDYKNLDRLNIIPLAGIRYGRFDGDRYEEKGTLNQNLIINKKTVDKTEAILGIKIATFKDIKQYVVIPEIHGFINCNLRPKSPKIDVRLDGMEPMPARISKPARILYNLGANLIAKRDMMDYEIGYDSFISKKFIAHQGTLKIKLNF